MKFSMVVFLLVGAFVLFGAGCGGEKTSGGGGGEAFSSIRDAFDRSISLRCEYVDENGQNSINYIKNKMIRVESAETTPGAVSIIALLRDDKFYLWDEQSNNGVVFSLARMEEDPMELGGVQVHNIGEIINVLEGKKDKCRVESVPDSYFEVPGSVKIETWDIPND